MKKFKKVHFFLSTLFFSTFFLLFLFLEKEKNQKQYPLSDHYNGKNFHNLKQSHSNRFLKLIKFLTTSHNKKWPSSATNKLDLHLNASLNENQTAITFVNHATTLIQIKKIAILTDPIWSERASPLSWIGPKRVRLPGIPFDQLPQIHAVLISHNHYDHLDLTTLKKLNTKFNPIFIVPLGNAELLLSTGILRVIEMDWWETYSLLPGITVTMAPSQHFSGRGVFDFNQTLWGSYAISFSGHTIYFAGDTGYSDHFKKIYHKIGKINIALLPIGAYEPQWFMQEVHVNPEEALKAHRDLNAQKSIGIHFGTFQLSQEEITEPVLDLKKNFLKNPKLESEFITVPEGRTRIFNLKKLY